MNPWTRLIDRLELSEQSQGVFASYYLLLRVLAVYDTTPYYGTNVFREGLARLSALGFSDDNYSIRGLRQHFGTRVERDIREGRGERS